MEQRDNFNELTMMELEERERRKEYVQSLTPLERGVYADMIMRSLRGSWRSPQERTMILEFIALAGEVDYYDNKTLRANVSSYFEQIGRGSPDGRFWRSKYEKADVDVTVLPEETIREMAERIPDDATWDDWRITKEFSDDG